MTGFPGVTPAGVSDANTRALYEAVNRAGTGKINATLCVTLTANQSTTAVSDARLGSNSFIGFCPLTVNAAAEIGAGTLYVSSQGKKTATLTHANNGQTDRTFRLLIIG